MVANSRQPLYQMKADFFKTLGSPGAHPGPGIVERA